MTTTKTDLFLSDEELQQLTGRKMKSKQIAWLRSEGLPFRVNAIGYPVVTRAAVLGETNAQPAPPKRGWMPRVLTDPK